MRTNATVSIPLPRVLTNAFFPYVGFVVAIALLFGGGARQGLPSDAIVELAALPLLAWAAFRLVPNRLGRFGRSALVLLGAVIALPLLQVVPLPPLLWTALPGRDKFASAYEAASISLPWLSVSLDPDATWHSLFALVPGAAVFLAILSAGERMCRVLILVILVVAFVSVTLDLLQLMEGPESSLRFYAITNNERAVGFFANANHNAAFLYCAMLFAAAWTAEALRDNSGKRSLRLLLLSLLLVMIVIGLAVGLSRAGIVLGFASGMSCLVLLWSESQVHSARRTVLIGLGVTLSALLIVFQFAFAGIVERLMTVDIESAFRWAISRTTIEAALVNLPFGSGLGTFIPAYQMFESRALLSPSYVNHAHNDWVEIFLTGGIAATGMAICFAVLFVRLTIGSWCLGPDALRGRYTAVPRAASIIVVLLMLHSLVDYPLRTIAVSVLFAIANAIVLTAHPSHRNAISE